MKKIFLITALALIAITSHAHDRKMLQGYPGGCHLFLAAGTPVVELKIYASSADALSGETSASGARPTHTVLIDAGPGYTIMNLHKESQALKICETVKASAGLKTAFIEVKDRTLTSLKIDSNKIQSDAYILKEKAEQAVLKALVDAYIQKDMELYKAKEEGK